jgi:hypothetical protein
VPRYAVQLSFASAGDRELVVPRLRELVGAGAVTADGGGARVVFDDVESPIAALVRSQILIHQACAGTSVAPTAIRRSPSA